MALRIIKQGVLDTLQDMGRYGYQHLGINPSGAMDTVAIQVANMLAGNLPGEAVIEMHYPAPVIQFGAGALIALSGADMQATLNDRPVAINQPLLVSKGDIVRCKGLRSGARSYLAIRGGFTADAWLDSYSTNRVAAAGGFGGRALQKDDVIGFRQNCIHPDGTRILPWRADTAELYRAQPFRFIPGAEYALLDETSREQLHSMPFILGRQSDRMGYRLQGASLNCCRNTQLISTAVTRGTMQLLPDGQLIVLMADHQTTGGYPRVGHMVSADIPSFSQLQPGQELHFMQTDLAHAEYFFKQQQNHLRLLQNACTFRLQAFFNA